MNSPTLISTELINSLSGLVGVVVSRLDYVRFFVRHSQTQDGKWHKVSLYCFLFVSIRIILYGGFYEAQLKS